MDELLRERSFTKPAQSRWLRKSRQAMGLDVKTLADKLGVSPRTINAWENESNENLPSRDRLFHYLSLLFEDSELAEPARLIEVSEKLSMADAKHRPRTLSRFFSRLSQRNQTVVNVLIRTLYRVQQRPR